MSSQNVRSDTTWRQRLIGVYDALMSYRQKMYNGALREVEHAHSLGYGFRLLVAEFFAWWLCVVMMLLLRESDIATNDRHGNQRFASFRVRRGVVRTVLCLVISGVCFITLPRAIAQYNAREAVSRDVEYTWSFAHPTAFLSYAYPSDEVMIDGGVAQLVSKPQPAGMALTGCSTVLEAREPFTLSADEAVVGFNAVATTRPGAVGFQLSSDNGATWYVWKRGVWEKVTPTNTFFSPLSDVVQAIGLLPRTENGEVKMLFRARLSSDCQAPAELSSVSLFVRSDRVRSTGSHIPMPDIAVPITTAASVPATFVSFKTSPSVTAPYGIVVNADREHRSVVISGQALAYAHVGVFIDHPGLVLYRTVADEQGRWEVRHDQRYVRLSDGVHMVYAVARDARSPFVSEPSEGVLFSVQDYVLPRFISSVEPWSTFIVLFLLCGALLVAVFKPKLSV